MQGKVDITPVVEAIKTIAVDHMRRKMAYVSMRIRELEAEAAARNEMARKEPVGLQPK